MRFLLEENHLKTIVLNVLKICGGISVLETRESNGWKRLL
jgi:hypothetical protein